MKNIRFKYIIQPVVFLLIPFSAYSQSIHVTGRVINKKKEAVEKANVVLRHAAGGRIVAFTQTSETGNFELEKDLQNVSADSLELNFSCVGYASQTRRIPDSSQPVLIELTPSDIALREVVVSAQSIMQRHDTISYRVSSFSTAEDRTIGDVLKKMPGVEVLESGEIKYQGQSLNKFYIEGSDMLGGRYGLATNNISHKDVASVEIMENHQPVKALEDVVFTGSPAMNIKLKEDAKSRWAGAVKGGAGIPRLWNAEIFAMRFSPGIQSLNTYKGNNTGIESFEMNLFAPTGDFTPGTTAQLPSHIDVSPSQASDIGSSRSIFNRTNNLTANNLLKAGKNFDLISEFTGSFERRESEQISQTTYFLGDEQASIEDKTENARDFRKAFTGKISLKSNQPTYYLNNHLDFSYDRNDPSMDILGSYPNSQRAGIENRKISNDFDILRRVGNRVFTFRSGNAFLSSPRILEVFKNSQPPVREDIRQSVFYSDNTLDYSVMIGKIRVYSPVRLFYRYRQMENEPDSAANRLNTHKLKLDVSPSVEYNTGDLNVSLSGVLYYQMLSPGNRPHHFWGVNPRLSLNWIASSMITVRTNFSASNDLPDENLFYSGNILNNYRNITAGYIDFSTGKSLYFSTGMEYRDILKILFANIGISLSKRRQTKIPGQDFEGDYIFNYFYPGDRTTGTLSVYGSFSKGIEWIGGAVSLFPLFVHSSSNILRNSVTIPYVSDVYSLRGNINSKISGNLNLTYRIFYSHTENRMETDRQYFSSNRLSESLKVTYLPVKLIQVSYIFDHYANELTANNYRHFFFSDVSASFLPGNRWEFSCSVKNIFDEKHYSYFIENELTSFYRSFTIRPRNVLFSATYRF
ncbi:MAG: TonB-dependent receptor [Tannerella sp.]|nr:TonB-dependent receptor [Tannerella sp.]